MISTTYSSETVPSQHHRHGKSIHLNGVNDYDMNPQYNMAANTNSAAVPKASCSSSSGSAPASSSTTTATTSNANSNNLHPVSHSGKKKYGRLRGLSISSGVSYTNFYTRLGGMTPQNAHFLYEDNGSATSNSDRKLKQLLKSANFKIIVLCAAWYLTSVLSSNVTKSILRVFRFPITLTEIQFFITSLLCFATYCVVYKNPKIASSFPLGTFPVQLTENKYTTLKELIKPTRLILTQTIPMGMFQFIGHITSHNATSLISVSMVHTIKALSPIVTVMSYRLLFKVKYPSVTYLTLIPLMVGIMLTCLFKDHSRSASSSGSKLLIQERESSYFKGLTYAFVSMLIFVSQNIFAKKILTYKTNLLSNASPLDDGFTKHQYSNILPIDREEERTIKKIGEKTKVDKLTILFYCSIIGFSFTLPIYLSSELFSNDVFSLSYITFPVLLLMVFHGLVHFVQALIAFHILGLISPVSYSIANIFKRIVVIVAALVWEAQPLNRVQGLGLVLTMAGLYCYDRWGTSKKHQK